MRAVGLKAISIVFCTTDLSEITFVWSMNVWVFRLKHCCNLSRRTKLPNKLPPIVVRKILAKVLCALDFLHNQCELVHCNIKAENILVILSEAELVI